jgi:3-dehydroquinate synthase
MVDDVLDPASKALAESGAKRREKALRRFLVMDSLVDRLYGDRIRSYFRDRGISYDSCLLPVSEDEKNLDKVLAIVRRLDSFEISRRREPIVVFGGGVLLDIVGFAASLYKRGIPYIRVPTTVIGYVDAGVGVKTGINFDNSKTRLGTYYPPTAVLLDRRFLATLDQRHISNGMGEIIKIGVAKDRRLFEVLESHGELVAEERFQGTTATGQSVAIDVLRKAISGMLDELRPNLWEHKLERIVDFGHTFSPSIEMRALPTLLHGEAVAIDMALSCVLAWRRRLITIGDLERVIALLVKLRLPMWNAACEPQLLRKALADATTHRDGYQRIPLPVEIGRVVFVNDVTNDELTEAAAILEGVAST